MTTECVDQSMAYIPHNGYDISITSSVSVNQNSFFNQWPKEEQLTLIQHSATEHPACTRHGSTIFLSL